jgi:hypothetical protein
MQRGRAPTSLALRRHDAQLPQICGQSCQCLRLIAVAAQHLLDHCPFRRRNLDPRWIARPIRMHPIAIGWGGPGEQDTGPQWHLPPPAHAFRNQRAFLFCHGAANLQQEVGLGGLAEGLSETVDLAARAFERCQEHHLMDRVPGESIGPQHQHTVGGPLPELVPQAIEPGRLSVAPL